MKTKPSTPDRHMEHISICTLKSSPIVASLLGCPIDQARYNLKKLGYTQDEIDKIEK